VAHVIPASFGENPKMEFCTVHHVEISPQGAQLVFDAFGRPMQRHLVT
jgi:hypothetical protein